MSDSSDVTRATGNARHVQREYDRFASTYDTRWKRYVDETTSLAMARLALPPGARLLDVGCGTGVLLHRVRRIDPGVRGVGIDLTRRMLLHAMMTGVAPHTSAVQSRGSGTLAFVQASGLALPLGEASMDVAVSTSALHYMPSPFDVLSEMRRVVEPGGRIVISDWCADYRTMRALDLVLRLVDRAHVATLTSDELLALMMRAGITVVEVHKTKIDAFWGIMTLVGRR
jgi:ubiquinone/menaquinone biosynthesis C-methylase UbiE